MATLPIIRYIPSMTTNNGSGESFSFSEEEINGFIELGVVLKGIHERLRMEGYIFKDGDIYAPEEAPEARDCKDRLSDL